jgi:hypothetical protein
MAKEEKNAVANAGRISLPLQSDGSINWDGVRDSTRDKFLLLLKNDPVAQEMLSPNVEGEGVDTGLPDLSEENIRAAIDIVSQANALICKVTIPRFLKHPLLKDKDGKPVPFNIEPDILLRSFKLTDEQHAELDPRALRLAQKHTPEWLNKNLDLYMLIGMYLKYTAENAQKAMKDQIQRDIMRVQQAQAQAQATRRPIDSDVHPGNGAIHVEPEAKKPVVESFDPGTVPPEMSIP